MKIVTTNEALMRFVPHSIKPVAGESPLFDKISAHLQLAEDWVLNTFMPEATFNRIASYTDTNPLLHNVGQLIVADALCRAIPSLDLVLTPNGFGVVGTQTVAAASKQRVDRLIGSMRDLRDEAIENMLALLPGAHAWASSPFAQFFGATLFPNIDLVTLMGIDTGRWEKYLELRQEVLVIEESLAEDYLSHEQLKVLRKHHLEGTLDDDTRRVVNAVRSEIGRVLKTNTFNATRMRDVVNFIRYREASFPEWHASNTAKLFSPPKFENKKNAKGYWF